MHADTRRLRRRKGEKKSLEHEWTLAKVVFVKAGIHLRTMSYPNVFVKITTRICDFERE
jgi:hypothetical protein